MGITWKYIMPLLSTLAALVIIVHSAEEDLESDYQYDLQPRAVDTGTPYYEQPWRALEVEPMMQQFTPSNLWENASPEEPPKRRRPGRKRKRRPQPEIVVQETPDLLLQDTQTYSESYFANTYQTTEVSKRHRKRPGVRPNRGNTEHLEPERPLRRRGQRKRQPSEFRPQLSEFSMFHLEKNLKDTDTQARTKQNKTLEGNRNIRYNGVKLKHSEFQYDSGSKEKERIQMNYRQPNFGNLFEHTSLSGVTDDTQYRNAVLKEDKSLSEFSLEVMKPDPKTIIETDVARKMEEKSLADFNIFDKTQDKGLFREIALFNDKDKNVTVISKNAINNDKRYLKLKSIIEQIKAEEKAANDTINENEWQKQNVTMINLKLIRKQLKQENNVKSNDLNLQKKKEIFNMIKRPIDPFTLKEILKKSNGTSLSEILQQHNLSLADLLHGREIALSVLKSENSIEYQNNRTSVEESKNIIERRLPIINNIEEKENSEEVKENLENQFITEYSDTTVSIEPIIIIKNHTNSSKTEHTETSTSINQEQKIKENVPKILQKRRFPIGIRRKLRMKPLANNTIKGHLNRDLITSNTRKYLYHNNRNVSKSKEQKSQFRFNSSIITEVDKIEQTTTMYTPEEITTIHDIENYNSPPVSKNIQNNLNSNDSESTTLISDNVNTEITTMTTIETIYSESDINVTEKSKATPIVRSLVNNSGLRRQAFNNRLKKKRLRQKNSTTENLQDGAIKDLFGMANLVSASEFITKLQTSTTIKSPENNEFITDLEDFITTEKTSKINNGQISTTVLTTKSMTTIRTPLPLSTTEETAKIEIEEILNDTRSNARLSKILMERNMTLNELVELRERGSSHVHLADIFHNASKEPNPPEPFLSKSLIEPISKETYPLRALLEANLHDPAIKATTIDSIPTQTHYMNIPIVLDFGNNVNENGENMGIMSLFNKLTGNGKSIEKSTSKEDSGGSQYLSSVIKINITNTNNTVRDGRNLNDNQSIINWNGIALKHKNLNNNRKQTTESFINEFSSPETITRILEDVDGDGLIVLEDLQKLKNFESNIASASDEKLEANLYETVEITTQKSGIFDKIPSNTKSVTVATSSIFGLAMILFLMTYAVFKWKQQRKILRKKESFCNERIPTPIFENRKGHKNNSSNRSISPMLSTSNIYAINTLEKRTVESSPDYMWETLRKPFQ